MAKTVFFPINPTPDTTYPFWGLPKAQQAQIIPGEQIAGVVADVPINRIPLRDEVNHSDVRRIPFIQSPAQQVSEAEAMKTAAPIMGRGAGVGLMDMMVNSINQSRAQAQDVKNGK